LCMYILPVLRSSNRMEPQCNAALAPALNLMFNIGGYTKC
jgi:hypothetical protein